MENAINIQHYLKHEITESRSLLKGLKKKSTKDLNHKLRVSIRRIRTVIGLLKNEGVNPLPKNENQVLKKMWKHLGAVRDFDVSEEIAIENSLPIQKIKTQRLNTDKKLQKDLEKKELEKLLNHLEDLSQDKVLKEVHPVATIKLIRQKLKSLPLEAQNMHAFRIILKKVRYLMEALEIEDDQFKKYQDVLGQLNDLKVFLECQGESHRVRSV